MNDNSVRFQDLMDRVRGGSQAAAWELVSTYGSYVERVVRRALHRDMRSKFNSSDFVQAVWASFFKDREQINQVVNAGGLIKFLMGIARNKVLHETRRRLDTQKTDVRREESIDLDDVIPDPQLRDREPTPSQWAIARECWDTMVRDQSPQHQRVIELRVSGATYQEIGDALGISERTARRVIDGLVQG